MRHTNGVQLDFFAGGFEVVPVMAIVPPTNVSDVVAECGAAWDAGVRLVEVPMRGPLALDVLRAAVAAGRERGLPVGAGTVLTREGLDAVHRAGAAYAVAPGLDLNLAKHAAMLGMPYLPGVATPTDVQHAAASGITWVKLFPAAALGAAWLRAVMPVFPDVRFVATGGIDATTAREFLAAGASAVAAATHTRAILAELGN